MERFLTEPQLMARDSARRFAEAEVLPRAASIDREDAFPRDLYAAMARLGLYGASLPEAAGGAGMDTVSLALVMEEIARCSGSAGNILAIPVEAARFLADHGSPAQKRLIGPIVAGELISATAVSEPDFGSDVASMRTSAVRSGGGYLINGGKAWVSLGGVADMVMVFAKTDPAAGHRGISCFLVRADNPGMRRGCAEKLLGMHGLATCPLSFEDCRVEEADRIGPEHQAFKMAMVNFNFSRILMSAMALGICRAAFEDSLAYAKARVQFGQPIIEFQAVQFMLADMATDIEAARHLIHHCCHVLDLGQSIAKEAAIAKLFTTEMAMKHATNAVQIHGGNGYSQAYRVERLFRDIKLPQIYEGTNQIQRLIIARQLAREGER